MPSLSVFVKTTIKRIKQLIKKHPYLTSMLVALAAVLIGFVISRRTSKASKIQKIVLSDFIAAINNDLVQEVVVKSSNILIFKTVIGKFLTDSSMMPQTDLFKLINSKQIQFKSERDHNKEVLEMAFGVGCFIGSCVLSFFLLRRNITGQHKFNEENQKMVNFSDVFGLEKPKEILQQTIDYLANPKKYQEIGCRLRTGIIFYGPPGTGKTMLAKAMATQSNSKFISCTASQFCEMYVGVGPKRIRQLFSKAKKYESAVIFIDEIDAIGHRRDDRDSDERNNTLNQLLTEMNGFTSNSRIVVIAATNRIQMIDSALLRSGRFDVKIQIPLPNETDRKGILELHLAKKLGSVPEQLINKIAKQSQGMCGADLQSMINEAAYKALRKKKNQISQYELEQAFKDMSRNLIKRTKVI